MKAHEYATAHRRRHWKDQVVVAVVAAVMSAALVYVFGGAPLTTFTAAMAIGILAYGAASLQIYRKRHELYLKRQKSHGARL